MLCLKEYTLSLLKPIRHITLNDSNKKSVGRVYGPKMNSRIDRIRVTAKLSDVVVEYDESFTLGVDNATPAYLAKFPLGQTPAFETKKGNMRLTEPNAIILYIASLKKHNPLLGKNKEELARIMEFNFFFETQLAPSIYAIAHPTWGTASPEQEKLESAAYATLELGLDCIERDLANKTYLVGDILTLADIVVAGGLAAGFNAIFDHKYRIRYRNIVRYYINYRSLPAVEELTGPVHLPSESLFDC